MSCEITISRNHPALAGHFPGQPMVPAAVLLDQLMTCWQQATQHTSLGLSLQQLRFTKPVQPDVPIYLEWMMRDSGSWRVSANQHNCAIMRGVIATTVAETVAEPLNTDSVVLSSSEADYQRLPHAGSMCLIEDMGCAGDNSAGSAILQPSNPLLQRGRFSAWLALEYAAQVFACQGVRAQGAFQRAQVAMVRRLTRHQPSLVAAGQTITVQLRLTERLTQACACEFQVQVDGTLFASGEFTAVFS